MQQDLTLAQLGARTGLSTSYLSQVERGKTAPSLPTLTEIAKALDVHLRHFFEIEAEAACIVRAERGEPSPHSSHGSAPGLPSADGYLSPDGGGNRLAVRRVLLRPQILGEPGGTFRGEEMVFVMSGELVLEVGSESVRLAAGDSIHFDAMQPHSWRNEGIEACTMIVGRAISSLDWA